MRTLSSIEAVSPAISRTKVILFSPFRFGRTWKLSITGYLSVYGSFFMPFPLLALLFLPQIHKAAPPWVVWVAGPGVIVLTGIFLIVFLLTSRLQFVFFDLVLNRGEFVAPAWRKYSNASREWTTIKAAIGTALTALIGLPIALFFKHVTTGAPNSNAFQPSPALGVFFFVGIVLVYLGLAVLALLASLVNDFTVPSLALEGTTVAEAMRRTLRFARTEPGQIALYAFLKVVLGFAAQMGAAILMEIIFLIVGLLAMLLGAFLGSLLHRSGVPASFLQIAVVPLLLAVWFLFAFYCMPLAYGVSITFLEAYKLNFLGGRYPLLGELLERSTPPPPSYGYTPQPYTLATQQPPQWHTAVFPPPSSAEAPAVEPPPTYPTDGIDTTE